MNVFILGDGSYTTGRKTDDFGVIIPSIIEFQRAYKKINKVLIFSNSKSGFNQTKKKVLSIIKQTNVKIDFSFILGIEKLKQISLQFQQYKNNCCLICTPDHMHFDHIKKALSLNLNTFVVKPFVLKTEHSDQLIKMQKNKKLFTYVDFHKRFDKQNILAKDKILNGDIGDILNIHVSYSQKKINPEFIFKKWINKTNILQYLGVHYIDLVYFLTGATPKKVMAIGQKNYLHKKTAKNVYDSIQSIIVWSKKNKYLFTQTLCVNWIEPNSSSAVSSQKYVITGTKGSLFCEQKERGLQLVNDMSGINDINPDFNVSFKKDNHLHFAGYGIESVMNFLINTDLYCNKLTSLKKIENILPTFSQSSISTKIIDSANQSLKNNSNWVEIK